MKNLFFVGFILFTSCNQTQTSKQSLVAPISKVAPLEQANTAQKFILDPSASQLTVVIYKDNHVPVTGTLNFKSGEMQQKNTPPSAQFILDETSFNSNLVVRDQRVTQLVLQEFLKGLIFNVEVPVVAMNKFLHDGVANNILAQIKWSTHAPVQATLNMSLLPTGEWVVVSATDLSLSLAELHLTPAVAKLIEVCGHQKIDDQILLKVKLTFLAKP